MYELLVFDLKLDHVFFFFWFLFPFPGLSWVVFGGQSVHEKCWFSPCNFIILTRWKMLFNLSRGKWLSFPLMRNSKHVFLFLFTLLILVLNCSLIPFFTLFILFFGVKWFSFLIKKVSSNNLGTSNDTQ